MARTARICRTLRFMHLDEHAPLASWAEAVALREAGLRREASGESSVQRRAGWEPLLIESLSKEAYNFMSELQSLLDSEAWSEGGRMITTLDPAQSPGLAPYFAINSCSPRCRWSFGSPSATTPSCGKPSASGSVRSPASASGRPSPAPTPPPSNWPPSAV